MWDKNVWHILVCDKVTHFRANNQSMCPLSMLASKSVFISFLGIQEVRYRMFVPLGAPVEALPGFHHPPPPHHLMQDLGRSEMTPNVTKTSRKSTTNDNNASTTPLDLRKSPGTRSTDSPSGQTDEECILPDRNMTSPGRSGRSPSGSRQTPDPNALKQKEIEAQLQFLKAKQVIKLNKIISKQSGKRNRLSMSTKKWKCSSCVV